MNNKKKVKILVTGANGQVGTTLSKVLKKKFGNENVITSDLSKNGELESYHELLDATNKSEIEKIVKKYGITQIYHLAAILSAKGEFNPKNTWDINLESLMLVLETAREFSMEKVFFPSSIAVFGPNIERKMTPQDSVLNPLTIYGISKAAGENLCQYYFNNYNLDIRSLRYPGIIGCEALPGGGTTDYAVDIFHKAVKEELFVCYLKEDTALPMIFMEDAIRATINLMDAPKDKIRIRTSYNIQAISFTVGEVVKNIRQYYPNFKIDYQPDNRQKIADSWPLSLDDSDSRRDWSWKPRYSLDEITKKMLDFLKKDIKKMERHVG